MKTDILGIQFDNLTREEAKEAGAVLLRSPEFHYAVTPNPEFILAADKDLEFQKILNQADLVLPDGIGVVYSAKILGTPLKGRVAGFDFACDMLDVLDEMGGRLYLLGAKPGVAEEAGRRILESHPNIVLCGTHDGYFKDSDPVAREVAQAQPDLLFVCLGAPKQEKWISRFGLPVAREVAQAQPDLLFVCLGAPKQEKWISRFGLVTGAKLAIGLGGALDVFAGNVERAPEQWQKAGMEWAYRLKKEPKRIGRMAKLPLVLVKAAGRRVAGKGRQGVL